MSVAKTAVLALTLVAVAICLGCDDASAKHSEPSAPKTTVIALDSSEAAKVSALLDKRNQLAVAGKQIDVDEAQLLTELKKAHGLPATASVSINMQTGKLEQSAKSGSSCYSLGDGRMICN